MDMEGSSRSVLQGESKDAFIEGIDLVMNRWTALRMAIQNESGGCNSRLIAQQLAFDVLSWFTTQSQGPRRRIGDLETVLEEGMLSLNTVPQDKSIQQVAQHLMAIHEECLQGNFRSVQILREETNHKQAERHCVTQIVTGHGFDEDGDYDESIIEKSIKSVNRSVNMPLPKVIEGEADAEWVVVSSRKKNKGRKN